MLKSFSVLLAKNDPQKMISMYIKEEGSRETIISSLMKWKDLTTIIEIAKQHNETKDQIITQLIESNMLDIESCIKILSWLNVSQVHTDLIEHIKKRFTMTNLKTIWEHPSVNPNAKKMIENTLIARGQLPQKVIYTDKRHHHLRMITEDFDFSSCARSDYMTNKSKLIDKLRHLLEFQEEKPINQEYQYIKKELESLTVYTGYRLIYIYALGHYTRLTREEKIALLTEIGRAEYFYPEYFNFFVGLETYAAPEHIAFFTSIPNSGWLTTWLTICPIAPIFLLLKHTQGFQWVTELVNTGFWKDLDLLFGRSSISMEKVLLLTDLLHVVQDPIWKQQLQTSSNVLRDLVIENLNKDKYDIEKIIRVLLIIGGEENYAFINKLLDRRIVVDTKTELSVIEKKYLELKRVTNNQADLSLLVQKEIEDKNNLISHNQFSIILRNYVEILQDKVMIPRNTKKRIVDTLPNLMRYQQELEKEEKVLLCHLINTLHLTNYKNLLKEYSQSKEVKLKVTALLFLRNLGEQSIVKELKEIVASQYVFVRRVFSSNLKYLTILLESEIVLRLIQDKNERVCRDTLDYIFSLPNDKMTSLVQHTEFSIYYKNRAIYIEHLADTQDGRFIPILVDILKEADASIYQQVMAALAKIDHPLSTILLQNMDLEKNHWLEIERAKHLATLGDPTGWKTIQKYFNLSLSNVSQYAKTVFIEYAPIEYLPIIQKLTADQNIAVKVLAILKLLYYKEGEGWSLLERTIKENKAENCYPLSLLLMNLPFERVKPYLLELLKSENLSCRTTIALIFAKYGIRQHIKAIENQIPYYTEAQLSELITALIANPTAEIASILNKLILLQREKITEDAFMLYLKLDPKQAKKLITDFWRQAEDHTKIAMIHFMMECADSDLFSFVKEQYERQSNVVQTEMIRMLYEEGYNEYWDKLIEILNDDNLEVRKYAIDTLSRMQTLDALKLLSRHILHPSEEVQVEIIRAIGGSRLKEGLTVLNKLFKTNSNRIKIALSKALGDIGGSEALELLKTMLVSSDEYVRVAIEISIEKIAKGDEKAEIPFEARINNLITNIYYRLYDTKIEKIVQKFYNDYDEYNAIELREFRSKMVIDKEYIEDKKNQIQKQLTQILEGCTEVEKIIKAKEKAQREINSIVSKEDLVKSLLVLDAQKLSDDDMRMLFDIVDSKNEDLIKAILIVSLKEKSIRWLEIINGVLSLDSAYRYIDFALSSLSCKLSEKVLIMLIPHLNHGSVRYYYQYFMIRLLSSTMKLKSDTIQTIKESLATSSVQDTYKILIEKLLAEYSN